jgi:hypothetical protein
MRIPRTLRLRATSKVSRAGQGFQTLSRLGCKMADEHDLRTDRKAVPITTCFAAQAKRAATRAPRSARFSHQSNTMFADIDVWSACAEHLTEEAQTGQSLNRLSIQI